MKVLGFVGSPRARGNTAALVTRALDGAQEAGAEVELVHLPDLSISGCKGCKYCKTHETCRIDDDMQALYLKIQGADRFIFGTPVYFAQMTGQMKLFIDRLYALINADYSPRIPGGKKAAVILTQGDENAKAFCGIVDTFGFAMGFLAVEMHDAVIVPGLDGPNDLESHPDAQVQAFTLGKTLIS